MAEGGDQLIHLDLGDPAFPTPSHIVEAAYRALKAGQTHYTESRGLLVSYLTLARLSQAVSFPNQSFNL